MLRHNLSHIDDKTISFLKLDLELNLFICLLTFKYQYCVNVSQTDHNLI